MSVLEKKEGTTFKDSKGFIAGVASGITKCTVGHPFDTIKVRLQTTQDAQFRGPLDCVLQTVRKEGVKGFYKGMSPPLVGWMGEYYSKDLMSHRTIPRHPKI